MVKSRINKNNVIEKKVYLKLELLNNINLNKKKQKNLKEIGLNLIYSTFLKLHSIKIL